MNINRFASLCVALLCAISTLPAWSQDPAPSTLNFNTPANTGGTSTFGTVELSGHEQLSIATGTVGFSLPVVSLPQRGGRSLDIGFIYSSNTYALKETNESYQGYCPSSSSNDQNCTIIPASMTIGWQPTGPAAWGGVLHANIPTLTADILYSGVERHTTGQNPSGSLQSLYTEYCVQNWTFTDWQGTAHTFSGYRDCSAQFDSWTNENTANPKNLAASGTYAMSQDEDLYKLDVTNTADLKVTDRSGNVYHFNDYTQPDGISQVGGTNGYGFFPNYFVSMFTSMVDTNNNTVSITYDSSQQATIITDTVGRNVAISNGGQTISYQRPASTGSSATALVASVVPAGDNASPGTPIATGNPCYSNYQPPPQAPPFYYYYSGTKFGNGPTQSYQTLTLANGLAYKFTFDNLMRLTQVSYPAGGYTRYDYASLGGSSQSYGSVTCQTTAFQAIAKHECHSAQASCTQSPAPSTTQPCTPGFPAGGEATTCYRGTFSQFAYTALSVTDPNSNLTSYSFLPGGPQSGGGFLPPYETNRSIYSGSSSLLRTIHTDYVSVGNACAQQQSSYQYAPFGYVPCLVTTTENDATPVLSKTVATQYETLNILQPNGSALTAVTDIPSTVQMSDFNGDTIRSTSTQWEQGGIYDPATANILDHVLSTTVTDGVLGKTHTTANTYYNNANLHTQTVSGTNVNAAVTTYLYNTYGDLTSKTDPRLNATTYTYAKAFGDTTCSADTTSSGLPASITDALQHVTTLIYYSCSGLLEQSTDANNVITAYTYDTLNRITSRNIETVTPSTSAAPATSVALAESYSYPNDLPLTVTYTLGNVASETVLDGSGRVSEQIQVAPEGQICSERFYDAVGNVHQINDPHLGCAGSLVTNGYVQYDYDALNRPTLQTNEDRSTKQWTYSGETLTATDEIGHPTIGINDALGRLVMVKEADATNKATVVTQYTYDGFNNLTNVTQSGASGESARTRKFSYDGLSRLLTAQNTETGTVCYGTYSTNGAGQSVCSNGYDLNGNLQSKTDARSKTTSFSYDALNRMVSRFAPSAQNNGQGSSSCFLYDANSVPYGVGHLAAEWTQAGNCSGSSSVPSNPLTSKLITAYDPVGRVSTEQTCVGSSCSTPRQQAYSYDTAGHLSSYGDGVGNQTFTQYFDSAGRFQSLSSSLHDATHSSSLFDINTFSPQGWTAATMGGVMSLSRSYDCRQRLSTHIVTAGSQGATAQAATCQ